MTLVCVLVIKLEGLERLVHEAEDVGLLAELKVKEDLHIALASNSNRPFRGAS